MEVVKKGVGYTLVKASHENISLLNSLGVHTELINRYGAEQFCIQSLAFIENFCDVYDERLGLIKFDDFYFMKEKYYHIDLIVGRTKGSVLIGYFEGNKFRSLYLDKSNIDRVLEIIEKAEF